MISWQAYRFDWSVSVAFVLVSLSWN